MIRRWAETDMTSNLLWLAVSLLLAIGVWYIAITSADPIEQSSFCCIPIQFQPGTATELTNSSARTASVIVQGPQTAFSSLRTDDIVVRADLSHFQPGSHTVPLTVHLTVLDSSTIRRPVSKVQPSQITVELESKVTEEKKIVIQPNEPPTGYRHEDPVPSVAEVLVSGAASRVAQVVAVHGELDLSESRNPIEVDLRLFAVDADGNRVNGVELEPHTVTTSVNITRRDDIRRIVVRPDILVDTLPEGFTLRSYSPNPRSLFIAGAPDQLARIADTLFTDPISLEDRHESFLTNVPIQLPDDELIVLGGDNIIMVSIEIIPIISSRQLDGIDVDHIGLGDAYAVSIVPKSVSAIVNGPVVLVDALSIDDIKVLVDLEGLAPGVYDLKPEVSIQQSELSENNISLVPQEVNVEVVAQEPDSADSEAATPSPQNG